MLSVLATRITAAFGPGLPAQYVQQQLTKSNMASSRTALLQAYLSFLFEGSALEEDHLQTWILWMLDEALNTGLLDLPTGDNLDRATRGKWSGPSRLVPDPAREWQASRIAREEGVAPSTIHDEHGYEYEDEIRQSAEDYDLADQQGIELGARSAIPVDPPEQTPPEETPPPKENTDA